jgi:hypothetical protein
MGIVNIEDELHDQLRRASKVGFRSINAQAAFWIRLGMLAETNPTLSFNEIIERELRSAGVTSQALIPDDRSDGDSRVRHDEAA